MKRGGEKVAAKLKLFVTKRSPVQPKISLLETRIVTRWEVEFPADGGKGPPKFGGEPFGQPTTLLDLLATF